MTGILRKVMPVVKPIPHDVDDDWNVEYSYAMEYHGPPVPYDIPQVVPVNMDHIPTASAVVVSSSLLNNLSFPVIQPIKKRENLGKKIMDNLSLDSKTGDSYVLTTNPEETPKETLKGDGVPSEESNITDRPGVLGFTSGDENKSNLLNEEGSSGSLGYDDISVDSLESSTRSHVPVLKDDNEELNLDSKVDMTCVVMMGSNGSTEEGVDHVFSSELLDSDTVESVESLNADGIVIERSSVPSSGSGSLGYVATTGDSLELSVLQDDNNEGMLFQDDSNPTEAISTELSTNSQSISYEDSVSYEDSENETSRHVRILSAVRIHDLESDEDEAVADIVQIRQLPERKGKKGSCYRCGKGNRFTEKEGCIVCGAKFCGNCVLRAMGSMPEGRKCITCIGEPINESKRESLGKSSRLLKRLLTTAGAKQKMKLEVLSKANQLQPAVVFVNEKPLCQEEIVILRSCSNPPKKLRPGYYWYDKESGFWGNQGQKPCQIITPNLNIGDPIKQDASNGNTNVRINNRVITKVELFMLQMAGIECKGQVNFWMSADGSIQEEGMGNKRGGMWDKTGMRLVCAFFSFPVPSEEAVHCEEKSNGLGNNIALNQYEEKSLHKLLLVGFSKSGTSTIFKQAKLMYNVPFTEDERQNIKFMIQSNLYGYLGKLLQKRQQFEEEEISIETRNRRSIDQCGPSGNTDDNDNETIFSLGPKLKIFSDWLLKEMESGNLESIFSAATREYAPLVEELWKNAAIQRTFEQISEFEMLPRAASYFLDRAVEVSRGDYDPSDTDILFAEGITSSNALASAEFSFPKSPAHDCCMDSAYHTPSLRYQLIRVHPRTLGGNCKWLDMFEDAGILIFCVDLTDYDQLSDDSNGLLTNKMMASKNLFEKLITHPTFYKKDALLILNKFDLLEEKIGHAPLTQCEWFSDFNPVISHRSLNGINVKNNFSSLAQVAFHYIALKFKILFQSLNGPEYEEKLYVAPMTALEPGTVDAALRYSREILKWDSYKPTLNMNDMSEYSMEESSSRYSH